MMRRVESLTATEQHMGTWSNPEHLSWIVSEVRKYAVLSQLAWVDQSNKPILRGQLPMYDGNDGDKLIHKGIPWSVTANQVRWANTNKILSLAENMRDSYLYHGIPELYHSWDQFSTYLMTPPNERSSISAHQDSALHGSIGAGCLLAHTVGQSFELELNGYFLTVNPDTMPVDAMAQYMTIIKNPS